MRRKNVLFPCSILLAFFLGCFLAPEARADGGAKQEKFQCDKPSTPVVHHGPSLTSRLIKQQEQTNALLREQLENQKKQTAYFERMAAAQERMAVVQEKTLPGIAASLTVTLPGIRTDLQAVLENLNKVSTAAPPTLITPEKQDLIITALQTMAQESVEANTNLAKVAKNTERIAGSLKHANLLSILNLSKDIGCIIAECQSVSAVANAKASAAASASAPPK